MCYKDGNVLLVMFSFAELQMNEGPLNLYLPDFGFTFLIVCSCTFGRERISSADC